MSSTNSVSAGASASGPGGAPTAVPARIEVNGINVIDESERRGRPSGLFWPWFAANISVFAISYGAFVLGFGISWWQALLAAVVGTLFSFLLCGLVALGGTRASAPTMVVSRAAFGVHGNRVPAAISWVLTVGWETVLVSLAALATATVFRELGWGGGAITQAWPSSSSSCWWSAPACSASRRSCGCRPSSPWSRAS